MSALSIQPTYPIFTDIDGQPLEAGYVWIGTANLDPQTNPINVYWDAALTISAPQPIRTLAGYPSRNGTPARLYVNSDYSIRVMNRNGSTVYSAPEATERFGNILTSANLANGSVTTEKLADESVTTEKLDDDSVTFAKMQNIATAVILGRSTAGTGDVEALTALPAGVTTPASSIAGALNASGAAPLFACRAWVNFNGTGTVAIRASGNVSSITDNGVGDYTVNFTTAMPDANYAFVGTAGGTANPNNYLTGPSTATAMSASLFRFHTRNDAAVLVDADTVMLSVFR